MGIYHCKVADNTGKIMEFTREASSLDALSMELINKGLSPLAIRESIEEKDKKSFKRYSRKSILEFTDTISMLINSGLSLKDALSIAQTIFLKGAENDIIVHISERLQKGISFHHALDSFGGCFPPLYKSLVRIGEKVGTLEQILKRLSKYLHDAQTMREKIVGALVYPLMLVSIVFVGLLLMVLVVFPTLQGLFSSFGPQLTRNVDSLLLSARIFISAMLLRRRTLGDPQGTRRAHGKGGPAYFAHTGHRQGRFVPGKPELFVRHGNPDRQRVYPGGGPGRGGKRGKKPGPEIQAAGYQGKNHQGRLNLGGVP
jgi:type II secretory pathway component PulF